MDRRDLAERPRPNRRDRAKIHWSRSGDNGTGLIGITRTGRFALGPHCGAGQAAVGKKGQEHANDTKGEAEEGPAIKKG